MKPRALTRGPDEAAIGFYRRLLGGEGEPSDGEGPGAAPVLAALYDGDLELPAGSAAYVLFPHLSPGSVAASDLLA